MIAAPYRPRPLRFIRRELLSGWQVKVYGIALPGQAPREALVEATVALAADVLPQPALTDDRYGAAFTIAHDAQGTCFALIYWWQSQNELHQRVFASPSGQPERLQLVTLPAAGCVWELGIIDFERRAWIEDVLANPDGPDFSRYFGRRFDGEV